MTTSGLPSLLLPCPQCLVRMQPKATATPGARGPQDGGFAETHDTFGCAECGVEVTRTHPTSWQHAA